MLRTSRGGTAALLLLGGVGIVGLRDPRGIRPLCFGQLKADGDDERVLAYAAASESSAFCAQGFDLVRDVAKGEAVIFSGSARDGGGLHVRSLRLPTTAAQPFRPCIFEYIYMARPDSVLDGVEVYAARKNMGTELGRLLRSRKYGREDDDGVDADSVIDVVVPVPDTSRVCALTCASILGVPYEEGLTKTRHIARTFIMSSEQGGPETTRSAAVRKKLAPVASVLRGKRVLLVDDSIVRGSTAAAIVDMLRGAGCRSVHFASSAPPVLFPNFYGIDLPTGDDLIARHAIKEFARAPTAAAAADLDMRMEDIVGPCVASVIGADSVVFQRLTGLRKAVNDARQGGPELEFEESMFTGSYPAGRPRGDDGSSAAFDASDLEGIASIDVV
uniref:Phosphoribosyltransferase domain-containing protein n=1 Tax=Phaeomonas parva TaxID=124430 RepID=A0A7S1UHR1_9STRA